VLEVVPVLAVDALVPVLALDVPVLAVATPLLVALVVPDPELSPVVPPVLSLCTWSAATRPPQSTAHTPMSAAAANGKSERVRAPHKGWARRTVRMGTRSISIGSDPA
jgi:hypothetical protein